MSDAFLNRTKNVILKNIENDKFGVSELANELGLSRSQVLRKIKAIAGISANRFIRQVRLEEAVKLLQEEELTASEIAYKVGFSSPSYFNKCFHDHYGFTPGDYKKQNGTVPQTGNNNFKTNKRKFTNRIIVVAIILVPMALALYYLFMQKDANNTIMPEIQKTSIAVLPLLDLSENNDKDYLAIGLTDAITLELAKKKGLRVVSRGSAMVFRDSTKLYSEIAEKLGVDLLLEGSVIHEFDSLRVIVQLIQPFPEEKHLWANKYDQLASDVFKLTENIASQITNEIHLAVAQDGKENLDDIKEVNPVAYELFLRGKYFWEQQNPQAVKKAIDYLTESIKIDSGFASAYCVLAEAYVSMNKFIQNNEEKLKNRVESRIAINYALNKAIELDGTLAKAYITKGVILRKFDWDWQGMKEMAEKGLMLNPNNPDGYTLLSDYYLVTGDYERSLEYALMAVSLDPLNLRTGCLVAERYMHTGEYDKSIKQFEKVLELDQNYGFAWDGIGYVYYVMGELQKAIDSWKELHKIMGNHEMAKYYENESFERSVSYWLTQATGGSKLYCSNPSIIAMAHLFVDKKEGALDYLEFAFRYKNEDLPIIILRPNFKSLYNEPRFKMIVDRLKIELVL